MIIEIIISFTDPEYKTKPTHFKQTNKQERALSLRACKVFDRTGPGYNRSFCNLCKGPNILDNALKAQEVCYI